MKKRVTTRVLLTMGLVSLVSSALLLVFFMGILPDRLAMERENRLTTAELLAASSMSALAAQDYDSIERLMAFARERDARLISTAVRESNGTIVVQSGDHATFWQPVAGDRSTETEIVVPLFSAGERWGSAEMKFTPVYGTGVMAFLLDDRLLAALVLSLLCFIAFYLYLGRMLKHLDPSKAVPDRVRNALDTLTESLLLIDAQGQIVLANKAFSDLVGLTPTSLIGSKATRFEWLNKQAEPMPAAELPWARTLATGESALNAPIAVQNQHGETRTFQANSAPIMGDEKTVNGALVSLDDITELEEKEVELIAATRHAEQANQAKSDFLANMSHEIRTPMNAVLGFTELMRRGQVSSALEANKYLETIHRNGKHLLGLINDILDLSKVEAGQFEVESIATEAHIVIHEVIEILSVRAKDKGIGLRFEVGTDVPACIETDPARLRQILTNLIGNAIKFTESGEVVVTQRFDSTPDGPILSISVKDSGVGIPQDKLKTIFDPFTQAESSTTRRFGGTGLGLTISRKFALAMGGDVSANSVFGSGSEFLVTLPALMAVNDRYRKPMITPDEALNYEVSAASDTSTSWRFEKGSVLVVDDSPENRQLVKVVLSDVGLSVTEAENGQEAVDLMEAQSFDVVLMDMQMPVMDGYTATRLLRDRGVKATIIAFTAHALSGFDAEIEAVGCDGYLTKPIDIDAMLDRLAEEIGASRVSVQRDKNSGEHFATQDLQVAESSARSAPNEAAPTEETAITSRLANQPRLHKIVTSFVDNLPKRIAQMQTELLNERLEDLAASAHWLKGSAGSVGFDDFTEPARTLEESAKADDLAAAQVAMAAIMSLAQRVVGPEDNRSAASAQTQTAEAVT